MPERSISPARSKSAWIGWGAILHSARSLTQWSGRRNRALPFKESQTVSRAIWFILHSEPRLSHSVVTHNVRSTISVVIVAGACGIAAGTPLAILGGIGRLCATRFDYQGRSLSRITRDIDTILLDKTGTLTYGTPEVVEVRPVEVVPVASLLQAAVTAESRSEHPVAKAILKKASNMGISSEEPERFDYTPGKGIVAARSRHRNHRRQSASFLRNTGLRSRSTQSRRRIRRFLWRSEGKFLGTLVVADTLRPEATEAIQDLKSMGLKTVLLTGDSKVVAEDIGKNWAWTRSPPNSCPRKT